MNSLTLAADDAIGILKKNSPKILLGTGIGLGVGAVAASGFASFKAAEIIRDIQCDPRCDNKKIAAKEYLKRVLPLYIPVAILETGSVICLVKSYDINAKRLAAATALAEMSIETFRLYKDKAKKVLGEEKVQELEKEVREEELRKDEEKRNDSDAEHFYNYDIQWFRDSLSEQEFLSTINDITRANLKLSEKLSIGVPVSKNEWLDILHDYSIPVNDQYMVGAVPNGEDVGWVYGQMIHVYMDKVGRTKVGNHPCTILTYSDRPISDYRSVHYGRYY